MTYPLTFSVKGWPLKDGIAGGAVGLVIFIREGYENDEGLAEHEMAHVLQQVFFYGAGAAVGFVYTVLHQTYQYWPLLWGAIAGQIVSALLYKFVRDYRLFAEASAYKVQMKYPDRSGNKMTLETGAYRLALPMYDLGLTIEQAKEALQ